MDFMQELRKNIETQLNEEADKIIEAKVKDFKERLQKEKAYVVASIVGGLEIQTTFNTCERTNNFVIKITNNK